MKTQTLRTEQVERIALERAMPEAQRQAQEQLCQDCRDRCCLKGSICKAFTLITKAIAWEIVAAKAELN